MLTAQIRFRQFRFRLKASDYFRLKGLREMEGESPFKRLRNFPRI